MHTKDLTIQTVYLVSAYCFTCHSVCVCLSVCACDGGLTCVADLEASFASGMIC